jgi:hypothetical protein
VKLFQFPVKFSTGVQLEDLPGDQEVNGQNETPA